MENKLLVVWKINWKLEDLLKVQIILVFLPRNTTNELFDVISGLMLTEW